MTTGILFSRTELDLPFQTWKDLGFPGLNPSRGSAVVNKWKTCHTYSYKDARSAQ